MYGPCSIVALIPARGGSKGVPRKNLKALAGRPLISYAIMAARESRYVDAVVVSTDDAEIAAVARAWGAEVPFMRPAELAQDTSRSIDAVLHALGELAVRGRSYDVVVLLQPTSPLRGVTEVDAAIEVFFAHGRQGVASVSEVVENPVLTRRIDEAGLMHPLLAGSSTVRRQDMPRFWHVNGAIYINMAGELDPQTSLNDNPVAYVMPRPLAIDIDSLDDFRRAEELLAGLGEPGGDGHIGRVAADGAGRPGSEMEQDGARGHTEAKGVSDGYHGA